LNYHGFDERDKIAIRFAEEATLGMQQTVTEEPSGISEDTREWLMRYFSEIERLELIMGVTGFNFLNRFNRITESEPDKELPPQELLDIIR